ncbi:DUF1803 domain-containing protein [Candidatus Enterococcus mansonii]|uniref:DUF1803 domain-containing protein n=1 Tax=Candidatus Enterococcus mansonii TaxID=1834181 RepID=A0A242CJQ9_9ENTE|nr:DUF1803 domain-containing protein [Enterococcus sp. 4G2_DIV0659]OTO10465.1 hypothetical protein A5880_001149 [Enterococcus sp. 4G2_DIV0659]
MKNITYYYGENRQLHTIISDPLFNRIVDYFLDHQGAEVILRQIKTDFSNETNLEHFLDKLIKHNLLERKNRRYSLTFPIYNEKKTIEIPDSINKSIEVLGQDRCTRFFIFGEWLWSFLFAEEQDYFFGVVDSLSQQPVFLTKKEVGNNDFKFISISHENSQPFDLATYFMCLSSRKPLPATFQPLQNLIGDVDIDYFVTQTKKIIRATKRNKIKNSKRNIFQEALLLTNDLKKDANGICYTTTLVLEEQPTIVDEALFDRLGHEVSLLWDTIADRNQRVFAKQEIYSSLFNKYFEEQESLSYFKTT